MAESWGPRRSERCLWTRPAGRLSGSFDTAERAHQQRSCRHPLPHSMVGEERDGVEWSGPVMRGRDRTREMRRDFPSDPAVMASTAGCGCTEGAERR